MAGWTAILPRTALHGLARRHSHPSEDGRGAYRPFRHPSGSAKLTGRQSLLWKGSLLAAVIDGKKKRHYTNWWCCEAFLAAGVVHQGYLRQRYRLGRIRPASRRTRMLPAIENGSTIGCCWRSRSRNDREAH